jgi:hypothetical protein
MDTATDRRARRSTATARTTPAPRRSTESRQIRTAPESLYTTLSPPKPTSAVLPVTTPAVIPTAAAATFQPTVSHSRRSADPSAAALSTTTSLTGATVSLCRG